MIFEYSELKIVGKRNFYPKYGVVYGTTDDLMAVFEEHKIAEWFIEERAHSCGNPRGSYRVVQLKQLEE